MRGRQITVIGDNDFTLDVDVEKVKLCGNKVLVLKDPTEELVSGSDIIVAPEVSKATALTGTIVGVGTGVSETFAKAEGIHPGVRVGWTDMFGKDIGIKEDNYVILRAEEIAYVIIES